MGDKSWSACFCRQQGLLSSMIEQIKILPEKIQYGTR
jgi:hypothetical protein